MGDGVSITSGGAIEVDSAAFREVGQRLALLAGEVGGSADVVRDAAHMLSATRGSSLPVQPADLHAHAARLQRLADRAAETAVSTQLMADVFELAELRARQQALAVNHPDQALALQERVDVLLSSDPRLSDMADEVVREWADHRLEGLGEHPVEKLLQPGLWSTGILLPIVAGVVASGLLKGKGTTPFGTTLQGAPPPVKVTESARVTGANITRNLGQALARIPQGDAQIRIEKRTYEDKHVEFTAYVAGTKTPFPGTKQPWDMGSNWDLYIDREKSASSAALTAALQEAGAKPGDRVDFVTYSQGGLDANDLAMNGPYETKVVVAVADPSQMSLRDDQMLVELRHSDDMVGSGLSGGGSFGGTGSSDSFTITRQGSDGLLGNSLDAHFLESYKETAVEAMKTKDVRFDPYNQYLAAQHQDLKSVDLIDYTAVRP
jgi:hypothetical protein